MAHYTHLQRDQLCRISALTDDTGAMAVFIAEQLGVDKKDDLPGVDTLRRAKHHTVDRANTRCGDIIHFGQSLIDADVKNVSVLSGFTLSDTPNAGMSVVVSARTADGARIAAKTIAT